MAPAPAPAKSCGSRRSDFGSPVLDQSMLKNAYNLEKTIKIVSASGDPPPSPRLPLRCYSRLLLQFSRAAFLVLNAFIPLRKKQNNYSKYSAFASSAILHAFFTSNSVVFMTERKNISCPRVQDTLATPLVAAVLCAEANLVNKTNADLNLNKMILPRIK